MKKGYFGVAAAVAMCALAAPGAAVIAEESVLVDDANCTFTVESYDPDSLWGYGMNVYLENKTDKTLMFSLQDASVNGCVADPFWASEVAAGMKDKTEIDFYSADLEKYGIEEVTELTFTVRIYDSEDWAADPYVEESFTLYPEGEEKATVQEREDKDTDIVLVDNNQFRVLVINCGEDDLYGYAMTLYIENKTDKNIQFGSEDVALNGYMCDPFWATEVPAGKKSITNVTWFQTELEEKGIETIDEIAFSLHAYESDDYSGDYLLNESFTINPQEGESAQ